MSNRDVHRVAAALLVLASLAAPAPSQAQLLPYANDGQKLAAAHVSPESTRRTLGVIQAACAKVAQEAGDGFAKQLAVWESRHARYLALSAAFRDKLDEAVAAAVPGSEKRAQLTQSRAAIRDALERSPAEMARGYTSLVDAASQQGTEPATRLCADLAQSIADGKWDLKRNDPPLAEFFEKQKYVKVPAAASSIPVVR